MSDTESTDIINSDDEIEISDLPPNREGAIIDNAAEETTGSHGDAEYNYCTISRWDHRLKLWKEYMANSSQPKKVPDPKRFLFCLNPSGDKKAVEHLIWGAEADSLMSLQNGLEALQKELEPLQKELEPLQKELETLQRGLEAIRSELEERQKDYKESQPSAVLKDQNTEFGKLMQSFHNQQVERMKEKEDLIKKQEDLIKKQEDLIKKQEELIHGKKDRIKTQEDLIKRGEAHIEKTLGETLALHAKARDALSGLAEKGNQTFIATEATTGTADPNRVDKSAPHPRPSTLEAIRNAEADETLLQELLAKEEITSHQKRDLRELQTFVAELLEKADCSSNKNKTKNQRKKWKQTLPKKIKNFADAILAWSPGTTIEALKASGQLNGGLACPLTGCETIADQPILFALIIKILAIIGPGSISVRIEQYLAPAKAGLPGRRIDFNVDEYQESLYALFPEMLGRAIEVKPASQDNASGFKNYQGKAREQVTGHLAKRLLCAFHFGGIGEEDVVFGVILSMISVQVLQMELRKIGTEEVGIVYRQTALVPLLGKTHVPHEIRNSSLEWDLEKDGVLLLASAMLELPRKTLFGLDKGVVMDCLTSDAKQERITLGGLLGSGSFAHVVKLSEQMFLKIPRSKRMVQSLKRECDVLRVLGYGQQTNPCIPRVMPEGVAVGKLSIRSEVSEMKVLRLTGIVGYSLSYCCNGKSSEKMANGDDVHYVIEKVHDALNYAHCRNIFHMDVRPSNIIVTREANANRFDVLLVDWGCSRFEHEKIKNGAFVGCTPYAHDDLLGNRGAASLKLKADFDFASLGYTWYHVVRKRIDWQFDRPKLVSTDQLTKRREKMMDFLTRHCKQGRIAQRLRKIFVQPDNTVVVASKRVDKKRGRDEATK